MPGLLARWASTANRQPLIVLKKQAGTRNQLDAAWLLFPGSAAQKAQPAQEIL
jgi:hypothetical protein